MKTSNFVWISLSSRTTYFSAFWYAVPLSSRPKSTRTPVRKKNTTKIFSFECIKKRSVNGRLPLVHQYQDLAKSLICPSKKIIQMHFLSQWGPKCASWLLDFLPKVPEDLSKTSHVTKNKKLKNQTSTKISRAALSWLCSMILGQTCPHLAINPARVRRSYPDLSFAKIINLYKTDSRYI